VVFDVYGESVGGPNQTQVRVDSGNRYTQEETRNAVRKRISTTPFDSPSPFAERGEATGMSFAVNETCTNERQ
jgi:hypothetical protein